MHRTRAHIKKATHAKKSRENRGFRDDSRRVERVPRAGFEPTTPGLGNRKPISASAESPSTCDNSENSVAFYVALLEREAPDLAAVVKAWNCLPPALKAGIVAMVQAANGSLELEE
jgi:hypothetical protein